MRRFAVVIAVALSLVIAQSHAGVTEPTATPTSPEFKLSKGSLLGNSTSLGFKGLLDPNRLTFRNTMGISFRSGAFGGMSQYYTNTITYRAAKPLQIVAQVGIENTSFGNASLNSSVGGARLIVPYFGVRYQPRENIQIDISFSHRPSYYGHYGGYRY